MAKINAQAQRIIADIIDNAVGTSRVVTRTIREDGRAVDVVDYFGANGSSVRFSPSGDRFGGQRAMSSGFTIELWSDPRFEAPVAEIWTDDQTRRVAVLRREPGEPFTLKISEPYPPDTAWEFPCEEFLAALRTAMERLGGPDVR